MSTPADPVAELTFEVERFDWTGDDRLEVHGRWYGIRGQRFLRPGLNVRLGDRRRRLIALLDHKPWAPESEAPWIAAFAWRGPHEGITAARLEVAPDIVIDLPTPGRAAAGTTITARARPRRAPSPRKPRPPETPTPPAPEPEAAEAPVSAPPPAVEPPPAAAEPPPAAAPPAATEPPPAGAQAPRPASAERDIAVLALERRLVEERAVRERVSDELADARRQLQALEAHHASAVERSREVVRLEGELAAAVARATAAERVNAEMEGELAVARAPIEVMPLPRRVPPRRGSQEWGTGTRAATVAVVAVVLVVVALILTTLL